MCFTKIKKQVEYDFNGDMVRFKNSTTDLLVTPNHKFFVRTRKSEKYRYVTAEYLLKHSHNYMIPDSFEWTNRLALKEVPIKNLKKKIKTEDFMAFLGIYLAEGSTFSNKKNYRVYITQKKENTSKEITVLLDRIGIHHRKYNNNFVIQNKPLYEFCKKLGLCHEKYIPRVFKDFAPQYLKILFEWLVKGDGYITPNGHISYYSTSKQLIDDVQEIALKIGYSGNISEKKQKNSVICGRVIKPKKRLYQLSIRKNKHKYFTSSKSGSYLTKEKYKGKVYCVEVGSESKYFKDTHTLFVRRNGKVSLSCNSIMGTNPIGCVFSEYSIQNPIAWDYIRPILVENGGWAIFAYTPRGMTHGYKLYNTARKNPHIWFSELLTIRDTGVVTEEDIEQERAGGMPEDLIEQEFFCSFSASQSRQFIPFSVVNKAVQNNFEYRVFQYAPVIIGVDIARFGDDKSVICVRKGLKVLKIKKYQKFDTVEMARNIGATQDEYEADYTYIDVGNMGAGVVDHLVRAMGRYCTEVNSGEKADDKEKYFNKRAEMWGKMRDWLKNGDIPDDPELIADLTNPQYEFNNKRQIVIETKKHMKGKGRNLPSPDVAESLLQTFYEEIMGDDDDFDTAEDYERRRYSSGENKRANVDETGY